MCTLCVTFPEAGRDEAQDESGSSDCLEDGQVRGAQEARRLQPQGEESHASINII